MPKNENEPVLGEIVIYKGPIFNGKTEHAAIVTAVHGNGLVNLKVMPDMSGIFDQGSVYKKGMVPGGDGVAFTWRWPA